MPIFEESGQVGGAAVNCGVPGAMPPRAATLSERGGGGSAGMTVTPAPGPVSEEVAVSVGSVPARSSAKITWKERVASSLPAP